MTTGVACPPIILQFFDDQGNVLAGGSVLTQVGGVNAATFLDIGLSVPFPNPIPLNSRGEISTAAGASSQLFLTPNTVYTFTVSDAKGNQILVGTYVNGVQISQSAIGALLYPQTAAEIAASVTPVNYAYEPLDTRRYGWVNDWNGSTGTNNYTAFANALLVAGQSTPGATVRIRGDGTNQGLVQGSATIAWPDYTGIDVDNGVQIAWNDNSLSVHLLTCGAAGARHGNISSRNLFIVLLTQTACGVHEINGIVSTHINANVQGFQGNYGTRTNVGWTLEATAGEGCWFNDFYGLNVNHCHTGVKMPSSSAGLTTQNTFRNFRHYGDATNGDTSAVAMDIAGSNYSEVDGFWIENIGASGYGFKLQGINGWGLDNGVFDSDGGPFTAISFDSACTQMRVGKRVNYGVGCKVVNQAASLGSGNINSVESVQGGVNGNAFTVARQNALGLLEGCGLIGTYFLPVSGGITIGGVQNFPVGGCVNPLDNLLYLATKQGNLVAYAPPLSQIVNWVQYSASAGDNDVFGVAYCPLNGFIYIPDRQDKSIVVVNPRTMAVVQTLSLTATAGGTVAPYALAWCPFNQKMYCANNVTANISVITPTLNGTDSVAQTLAGFTGGALGIAYCPITQKMYVGGNDTSVRSVTPTTNATDSILQTVACLSGVTACYAILYCPFNQKMYAIGNGTNKFATISPTTGGTDTFVNGTLSAGANSMIGTRGACWSESARAILCTGTGNFMATITPSVSGSADICPQVQATFGGTSAAVVYHPSYGKGYEINTSLDRIAEWS